MKYYFPDNPYDGQIYYVPSCGKVFRYSKPIDKDGERIPILDQWEDITDCFLNNPTGPFNEKQGEES